MANNEIVIRAELRPCIVRGRKAFFHKWHDHGEGSRTSPTAVVHNGGVVKYTTAIIEYEDGVVAECFPHEVKFLDKKIDEYYFGDVKNE